MKEIKNIIILLFYSITLFYFIRIIDIKLNLSFLDYLVLWNSVLISYLIVLKFESLFWMFNICEKCNIELELYDNFCCVCWNKLNNK